MTLERITEIPRPLGITDVKGVVNYLGNLATTLQDHTSMRPEDFNNFKNSLHYVDNIVTSVAQAGSDSVTLILDGIKKISADLTIPSNINIEFRNGGVLDVDSGYTVTINGTIDAGFYQIFDGDGTVVFDTTNEITQVKELYAEWWGAAGDGVTDDTDAIQAAIVAAARTWYVTPKTVRLLSKIYRSNTLTMYRMVTLKGAGVHSTRIYNDFQTTGIILGINADGLALQMTIEDLTITGSSDLTPPVGAYGIESPLLPDGTGIAYTIIRNVNILYFYDGIHGVSITESRFERVRCTHMENDGVSNIAGPTKDGANIWRDVFVGICGRHGFYFDGATYGQYLEYCGGIDVGGNGIHLDGVYDSCIYYSSVEECLGNELYIKGNVGVSIVGGIYGTTATKSKHTFFFEDNYGLYVANTRTWSTPTSPYGIYYSAAGDNNVFINNDWSDQPFVIEPTRGINKTVFINNIVDNSPHFDIPHPGGYFVKWSGNNATSSLTEYTFNTFSVPACHIQYVSGDIEVKVSGSVGGTAGAKTIKIYFGSFSQTVWSNTADDGNWEAVFRFSPNSSSSQRYVGKFTMTGCAPLVTNSAAAVDLTAAVIIKITGVVADGGDSITINDFSIQQASQ